MGANLQTVTGLSQTELLAQVIRGESTLAVKEKALVLASLLRSRRYCGGAGTPGAEPRVLSEGVALVAECAREGETFEFPEFVPRVEMFVSALADEALPLQTQASLMQHYERTGQFAKAEDMLYGMIEVEPGNAGLLDFGISFYDDCKDSRMIILSLETCRARRLRRRWRI